MAGLLPLSPLRQGVLVWPVSCRCLPLGKGSVALLVRPHFHDCFTQGGGRKALLWVVLTPPSRTVSPLWAVASWTREWKTPPDAYVCALRVGAVLCATVMSAHKHTVWNAVLCGKTGYARLCRPCEQSSRRCTPPAVYGTRAGAVRHEDSSLSCLGVHAKVSWQESHVCEGLVQGGCQLVVMGMNAFPVSWRYGCPARGPGQPRSRPVMPARCRFYALSVLWKFNWKPE
jgi:hypothetical protein